MGALDNTGKDEWWNSRFKGIYLSCLATEAAFRTLDQILWHQHVAIVTKLDFGELLHALKINCHI